MRALVGFIMALILLLALSLLAGHAATISSNKTTLLNVTAPVAQSTSVQLYLPLVVKSQGEQVPRTNAPYFDGEIPFSETAVFWFGQVTSTENYADVRVGYNDNELYLYLAAFDRLLWYDTTPSAADLTAWDSATLYLDLDGNSSSAPHANAYRFVGQINWWESRDSYQTVYQGNGSDWVTASVPFTTTSGWQGNGFNNGENDRGWAVKFRIPFTSLGLSGPPTRGTIWGLALTAHDRDDAAGTPIADQVWPNDMDSDRSTTWGQLSFGLPSFTPPTATPGGTVTIRHGLNGATVVDGSVGGGTNCGEGLDYWTEWGQKNYDGQFELNIQNQSNLGDWPCFSKSYVTFPLDSLPSGKVILSATLTLYHKGGSDPGNAEPSLIQVLTVADDWDEATLTWNNAPLALENVSQTWVDPIYFPGWPDLPAREWDISQAVAQAYAAGRPLRLALYEADSELHSGKYFVSSDSYYEDKRPTLTVVWGQEAP